MSQYIRPLFLIVLLMVIGTAATNDSQTATGRAMAQAATAFLSDLNTDQRSKASFDFKEDSRFEFRYTPRARSGLPLKEMSERQRARAHALVKTGLSVRGYSSAAAIIELENVLRRQELSLMRFRRDPELYFISIYGEPGGKAPWGWKFEGHHLSVNFTIVDGKPIAFAPSFFGSNPAVIREGVAAGKRALREEDERARALMAAFDKPQLAKVIFSATAPPEMLTAENREAQLLAPAGITYALMTSAQKRLFESVLDAYLGRVAPDLARTRLDALQRAGMDSITFAWAGSLDVGKPHYYRVQGPTFLIEYDNVQNNANHVHSVWRDFDGDFGRDLLREHYRTSKH
jgi:hypothetical protein